MTIKRAIYDIEIYRGDTPTFEYQLLDVNEDTGKETPVDITNHTIRGQVRYSPESNETWFEFPIEKTSAKQGIFQWKVTKEMSQNLLPVGSGISNEAVYDLEIELNGAVFTFMVGKFSVDYDITRG
ncbi:hypothetical protein [Photobacterium damselae]|uniref:hypothetical protein n=1 Tax=Photobacterium damselae TaxID=38293 RepID=UPI00165D97A9|nr:hypothetical protein [Photobacterium damselae]